MPEKRIAFITSAALAQASGPAMHVLGLLNAMAARGAAITLLAPRPGGVLPVALHPAIRLVALPDPRRWAMPGAFAFLPVLLHLPLLWRCDTIYVRSAPGSLVASLLGRILPRRRLVIEFNGWIAEEAALLGRGGMLGPVLAWMQAIETRLADGLRVVTARLAERAIAAGASPERVHVIPTGADLTLFHPQDRAESRAELGLPVQARIVAFLGNLWSAIDFECLFEAVRLLGTRRPDLPLLLVIGGSGPLEAQLRDRARAVLGEDDGERPPSVRFLGALAPGRANLLLGAADVTVAPFVAERNANTGLSPLKLRDSAAAGRVVVSTDLPGISELAACSWLFLAKSGDPHALADALEAALASDLDSLGAAARAYAEAHFDWRVIGAEVLALAHGDDRGKAE